MRRAFQFRSKQSLIVYTIDENVPRHFNIFFEEIRVPLFVPGYKEKLAKYSFNLTVPILLDGDIAIWDSLAICEHINEKYLNGTALPSEELERAICRTYCAEMHSGFITIREQLPMNCRSQRQIRFTTEVLSECKRVDNLWQEARQRHTGKGDYLFGDFSIADSMFAPIVCRFSSYGVAISLTSQRYMDTILANYAVTEWMEDAKKEAEILPDFEVGTYIAELD
jgi:glutathione S-transferase